jgi:hypothetical protein
MSKRYAHDFSFNFTVHSNDPKQGSITIEEIHAQLARDINEGGGGMEHVGTWDREK